MPPSKRPKPSLPIVAAVFALAALAPSPATAQDDAPALGICMPSGEAPGEMDFNGYEFCAVDQAAGGGGGGSAPSAPGGNPSTVGHEVVRVSGVVPRPKPPADPIAACARRLSDCLSKDSGGGGRLQWADRDGPGKGESAKGGNRSGDRKQGETRKADPKKPSKAQCEEAEESSRLALLPELEPRYRQLEGERQRLDKSFDGSFQLFWELDGRASSHLREVERLEAARTDRRGAWIDERMRFEKVRALRDQIGALKKQMDEIQAATGWSFGRFKEIATEMDALVTQSQDAREQLIAKCRRSGQL
jgi:hypothetical protein